MRSRAGTHVYVAVSECGLTKVGATSNLVRRSGQLRYFGGRRYAVYRFWKHDDPFAIEFMVCHALCLRGAERVGKEEFAVAPRLVVRAVNRAIAAYRLAFMSRRSRVDVLKFAAKWRVAA